MPVIAMQASSSSMANLNSTTLMKRMVGRHKPLLTLSVCLTPDSCHF